MVRGAQLTWRLSGLLPHPHILVNRADGTGAVVSVAEWGRPSGDAQQLAIMSHDGPVPVFVVFAELHAKYTMSSVPHYLSLGMADFTQPPSQFHS